MWTSTITIVSEGVANAIATIGSFNWSATIKTDPSSLQAFADEAKKQYALYQGLHKDDEALQSDINSLLNQ